MASNLYRCFYSVNFEQVTSVKYPNRNLNFSVDFVNLFEVFSSWENLTNNCNIVFPKNIQAKTQTNQQINISGNTITLSGEDNPLFLRGDKVNLSVGYWYNDENGNQQQYVKLLFSGYISKVESRMPIRLECEDAMFILKQTKAPDKVWGNGVSLQDIVKELVKGTGVEVSTLSTTKVEFTVGTFFTKNETVAQVLARLKRVYKIGVYLKDNVIRIGYPTYYPDDVQDPFKPYKFIFQHNIISHNLAYSRKDDINISCVAQSYYTEFNGASTIDGNTKTSNKKLIVFLQNEIGSGNISSKVINSTTEIPQNEGGERFTFFFPFAKTAKELTELAKNELQKKYYTGFKGSFETFFMPYIPLGDNIIIEDRMMPDRNGTYKVKGVNYKGGAGIGIRQNIFLDYKIDV